MSLINQALRKVQRERAANKSTIQTNTPGTAYVHHNDQKNNLGLLVGLGAFIVILIVLVAVLLLVLARDPIVEQSADAVENIPDTETDSSFTQEEPEKEPHLVPLPPRPALEHKQEITEWLSQSTVSGIRISRNGNKVILNNKAFITGEIVNSNFDLKLSEINEDTLSFIDSNGVEYIKRL